ncbi:MAG TPA: N-acetyltransferase [Pirellulales bacterium]|nr:N-acetyltransferase [Pirellulales bacterium]
MEREAGVIGMEIRYFKRFRMDLALAGRDFSHAPLPPGYRLCSWHQGGIAGHAAAKFRSFHDQIDADVFPCLGDEQGCYRLMTEIAGKPGFLPTATWLLAWQEAATAPLDYIGTIQGIWDRGGFGSIQNLGVAPEHRGQGLGEILLRRALAGFQQEGLGRVFLEVTAENLVAIHLYEQLGFSRVRTSYKAVDAEPVLK